MTRPDHTFAMALAASLLLHAAIVFVIADEALHRRGTAMTATSRTRPADDVSYLIRPPPSPPQRLENLFGDARGSGDALNSRRAVERLLGRDGDQTQAFLSRDPVGPGKVDKEPSMSVLPTGSAALAALASAPPPAPRVPFGVGDRRQHWSVPQVVRPASATVAAPAAGADAPGAPGVPLDAADPAVISESESDPFTTSTHQADAVVIRDGRVEVRLGRKVKTIRPHLSLSSQLDLMGMQFPRLVVRLHIDADGSVRRVDIIKSTGSAGVDQEVKVALYQWWLEPTKEEVVEFPITWR